MNCAIMFYFHLSYFVQVAISSENPYVMGRFCGSVGFVLELTDTNFSGFISSPGSLNVAIFSAPGRRYKKLRSFVQKPCISNVHKKEDTGFCTKLLLSYFVQVAILPENPYVLARIRGIPAGTYWPVRMEEVEWVYCKSDNAL